MLPSGDMLVRDKQKGAVDKTSLIRCCLLFQLLIINASKHTKLYCSGQIDSGLLEGSRGGGKG